MPNTFFNLFKGTSKDEKEKHHPQLRANWLSNLFFCWIFPILFKGYETNFQRSDLIDLLPQHKSSSLGDKLELKWSQELLTKGKPTLWKPIAKIFITEFLFVGVIVFINEFIVKLSQPILIWKLITTQGEEAYIYASMLVLASFLNVILYNWTIYNMKHLAMKIRIACSSLIYRKSLKLNKNGNKIPTGQIVNLLSNDLNRFDRLFIQIHYLWVAPLEAIITFYLLYVMLGWNATVGLGLFFIFIPIQMVMAKLYSNFQLSAALKTDERVRLLNEIVSAIQVIKMYIWENLFIKMLNNIRGQELSNIRGTAYLKAIHNAFNIFLSKGAVFLCILLYVFSGKHLQSQYVFVVKSFYTLLKQSMSVDFPEAIKNFAEASISVKRIEEFLLTDETTTVHVRDSNIPSGVFLDKASAKWSSSVYDTLSITSFRAGKGQFVALLGNVGSGKTSLIKVIIQELPLKEGTLAVNGKISYAGQEPWLFAGTVKDNILFGQPFNSKKYNEVVRVCALNYDFKILPFGDNSIVGDSGITLSGGQKARISLARTVYNNADIYILDNPLAAVDASTGKQLYEHCILGYLKDKCVIMATHQIQYIQKFDWIYLLQDGIIADEGRFEHIRNLGKEYFVFEDDSAEHSYDDSERSSKVTNQEQFNEYKNAGSVSWKVYCEYLLSAGWCIFILVIVLCIFLQSFQSGADYFESYWVELEETSKTTAFFSTTNCIYIYSALISSIFLFSLVTSLLFYYYFIKTSAKLHDMAFNSVIRSTIQFFCANPTGSILNRFSKDLGTADTVIPKLLMGTLQNGLNVLAVFLLVGVVDPWMLLPSTVLLILFCCIRIFYLSTSRELKRIEAITRSPVYSHLNESLHGLETIRTFEMQSRQNQKFHQVLDENSSAFYLYITMSSAFGIWLGLFCSIYVALVTFSCFWGLRKTASEIGLVITQTRNLSELLSWGMIQWSEFENEMTSVERILQYKDIDCEENTVNEEIWASSNSIEFKNVSLRYKEDVPAVLRDLSFKIAPNEKIGIVGRTGAGKSSVISAIFRLAKFDGAILVGDVNINNVSLETVRSNISIIPQDPVLFSGTIRDNLDPFEKFSDHDLWSVLDQLDLKRCVSQLPSGLESLIMEKGANLSVGQRQLFCLARALLRRNNIVILDEATASMDYKTDSLIQSTIKKKLVNCTVLIIAHRLDTIIDCDKVIVMDAGRILEFDHPHKLLENENGAFSDLVAKTGPQMTKHLKEVAEKHYNKCPNAQL